MHFSISPVAKLHGTGGVQGVLGDCDTVGWGCGGMPFQDGNRSASGGSVCGAFLKSEYHLLAKGEKGKGKGMLMPCLLEVFGQIWITVVLQDLGSLLLTSLP